MNEKMKDAKKFLLIDGSSLIFRAFFAIRNLTTKDGIYTNAVYGFLNMYLKAVEMIGPDYVLVAFDRSSKTFRTRDYEAYKGTREETPNELSAQFGILKDVLDCLGVRHLDMDGFEADDIVGTLAKSAGERNITSYLLTGDRDYFQLVDARTQVLFTKKGISELEVIDVAYVAEKYGLEPKQLIEVKGLQGDTSDNIPGVPGVGEKTAVKLIQSFGSIDGVYAHIDEVSGRKLKENLIEHETTAYLSRKLGTIFTEVPLDELEPEAYRLSEPDREALAERFERLEFSSLAQRFEVASRPERTETFSGSALPKTHWANYARQLAEAESFSFAVLTEQENYIHAEPHYIAFKSVREPMTQVLAIGEDRAAFAEAFGTLFASPAVCKRGFDIKAGMVMLGRMGITLEPPYVDTMLMAYLIDPGRSSYLLADIASRYADLHISEDEAVLGKGKKRIGYEALDESKRLSYSAELMNAIERIESPLYEQLEGMGMRALFETIENPLAGVLARMEQCGIAVDPGVLDRLETDFGGRIDELEAQICEMAGEAFNINSPKQLGEILFERLGLPHGKKTKTGYSTSADILDKLRSAHPIVDAVLNYRMLSKLKSTYIDGFRPYIDADSRVRSIFKQHVAATGRLSSTEPNLQNIPVRTEEGRQLRAVFIAEAGRKLVDADYSQIELRILAALSGDENMIAAFSNGEDIHRKTAAEVNGIPQAEVTSLERSKAKAVNFGIIYGISDYGLSQDLNIPREEAKHYIDSYKATYPRIKDYMDAIVEQAREDGYVDTFYGRRRNIPELSSSNFNIRGFGERIALNTPIQGTAADVIKLAMIRIDEALRQSGLNARLVLQIHDELILEADEADAEAAKALLIETMEGVGSFEVKLKVDADIADSWFDAK